MRTRRRIDTLWSRVKDDVLSDGHDAASAEVTACIVYVLEGPVRAGGLCMPSELLRSVRNVKRL
jgi:hypothetical protein